jgi:hypothetical protein
VADRVSNQWMHLAGDNYADAVTWVRLGGYVIWRMVFDYGVDRKDNLPLGFSFFFGLASREKQSKCIIRRRRLGAWTLCMHLFPNGKRFSTHVLPSALRYVSS